MLSNIKNILYISTGGGIGDTLSCIPIINYLNKNIKPEKIYFYSTDLEKFWFEKNLIEFKPKNLVQIKNFPQHFGTKISQINLSNKLMKFFDFNYFDLIIDNQTVFKNTIIYKRIPHKYYISPCLMYLLSKPFLFLSKTRNTNLRIINYLNKLLQKNDIADYSIEIPLKFLNEAKKIIKNDKKYIGFSITKGHPGRNKEIDTNEIVKLANYYSNKYIPTFFIENKYHDLKQILKANIKNSYFPEELIKENYQKPMMVTALGSLTSFNITIDNGISHMLSFSNNKNYIFYNNFSEKFRPLSNNNIIYDCKINNRTIEKLTHKEIINFINNN